ncbi:MAG: hypothetical protein N5P05_001010 [Chroococcopsis gigantea SAG 12.99]|nr:hypothetical protein [Chlorogloea purpurea SAG 13.99]MDV2999404.1 hypothetical protein [Chroococcopsis gigantea SAG 12.99]
MNKKIVLGSAVVTGLLLGLTSFTAGANAEMNRGNSNNSGSAGMSEKDCSPNSAMQTSGNRSPVCQKNNSTSETTPTNTNVPNSGTSQNMHSIPTTSDSPSAGSRNRMDDNYDNNPQRRDMNRNTGSNSMNSGSDNTGTTSTFKRTTTGGAAPSHDTTGGQK